MKVPIGVRKKLLNKIKYLPKVANNSEGDSYEKERTWIDAQRQLGLPRQFPLHRVHAISYERLKDSCSNRHDFDQFFAMYLRYFGYAFVRFLRFHAFIVNSAHSDKITRRYGRTTQLVQKNVEQFF